MKSFKISLVSVIIMFIFLSSCKKDEQKTDKSPYLTIQKMGLGTLANLDPELIQVIKKQMVEQERASDTARLLRTYDSKTGKLLINIDNAVYDEPFVFQKEIVDSSKIMQPDTTLTLKSTTLPWDHYYLKLRVHLQSAGWTGYNCGPVGANQFAGTRGQSLRMEAFKLSHDEMDPMVIPDIRYQANTNEYGWQMEQTWNGVAGITGISKPIVQLKIRSATPGYTTRYLVHVQSNGDLFWFYNGEVAGPYPYKRIEGMMVDIYKW